LEVIQTIDRIGNGLASLTQAPVLDLSGLPGTNSLSPTPSSGAPPGQAGSDFGEALKAAASERSFQISGHAQKRVDQRQISLDGDQLDRLQKAMDTLSARGSRQSLVMLDQVAYVVHVPSHTVITAVQPDQSKERVFTQIDSVIIG
jgi:flagellar operon protein